MASKDDPMVSAKPSGDDAVMRFVKKTIDQEIFGRKMKQPTKPFALCVDNTDYKASLIPGKVYRIIPDPRAAKDDFVRIVDESGEDYLYHKSHFLFVDFPRAVTKRILDLEHAS